VLDEKKIQKEENFHWNLATLLQTWLPSEKRHSDMHGEFCRAHYTWQVSALFRSALFLVTSFTFAILRNSFLHFSSYAFYNVSYQLLISEISHLKFLISRKQAFLKLLQS